MQEYLCLDITSEDRLWNQYPLFLGSSLIHVFTNYKLTYFEVLCERFISFSLFHPTAQLDRDGLHDLNVQGDWHLKGGTYWVRYIHVELLGFQPQCAPGSNIKVGDRVRVKRSVTSPRYKWGSVNHQSIGTVTSKVPYMYFSMYSVTLLIHCIEFHLKCLILLET